MRNSLQAHTYAFNPYVSAAPGSSCEAHLQHDQVAALIRSAAQAVGKGHIHYQNSNAVAWRGILTHTNRRRDGEAHVGTFLLEAILVSLSGVMAPGPMTAVTVGAATRSPHVGAWIAVGHGIIEIPLMIGVLYGFGAVLNHPTAQAMIGLVGGLFLLFMGINMLRRFRHVEVNPQASKRSPIMTGIVLSVGNPYFLIWWATVGATLVMKSVGFGILGFSAFAVLHWLCDFIWCYLLSALSFRGRGFFGGTFQRAVLVLSGAGLLFFSAKFLVDALRVLFS